MLKTIDFSLLLGSQFFFFVSRILWFIVVLYLLFQHKCAMYWPSRQAKSEVHGPLRVTYLDEEAFAFFTVRRFEVKPVDQNSHYCQVSCVMIMHNDCYLRKLLLLLRPFYFLGFLTRYIWRALMYVCTNLTVFLNFPLAHDSTKIKKKKKKI